MNQWPWWAKVLFDLLAGWKTKDSDALRGKKGVETVAKEIGWTGHDQEAEEKRQRAEIVAFMRSQLGRSYKLGVEVKPYVDSDIWDCSEITEQAYQRVGLSLPDGSPYQFDACQSVKSPEPGDLGFLWSDKWGRIGHVLVYTGDGTVVHAVGGRGVVEDPRGMWELHTRWRGWRRHEAFNRPKDQRGPVC